MPIAMHRVRLGIQAFGVERFAFNFARRSLTVNTCLKCLTLLLEIVKGR